MTDFSKLPPLKPLHPGSSLSAPKLAHFEKLATEVLLSSLLPGGKDALKTRPDGTILDGHHRVHVLRQRGVDTDKLPREIIAPDNLAPDIMERDEE